MSLADDRLIAARAAIARACLDALPSAHLGDITLRHAQRRIVARAERALRTHGGCLVGEDVGRGKTFIALALARGRRNPMIVAPAALRSTWTTAQSRAAVACAFVSHEALSRRRVPSTLFDMLIVDESHHFRNPATARYDELARMAATVPVDLLSATPLQNRTRDLAAQVALYYGELALFLPAESLARFVIRGEDAEDEGMPSVAMPEWIPVDADDVAVLQALLDLPPPPRPLDGGDAGALRTIALVRAWSSSRAALASTLRSRRRVTTALAQGVEAGRTPTRLETREWRGAEDVVQLGLAPLLMHQSADAAALVETRAQIDEEDAAHGRLREALVNTVDPDRSRVAAIRALRASHAGCRIVAFSEYAATVSAYFAALRADPGVGLLTSRSARIASGVIPRSELLARFAPLAQGAMEYAPHDAVTLLLATDLIAEGVNLQDASIVLHLDLPWNPARLAQRVGRVRRPGAADVVRSFLLAPPARANVLLTAEARLRRKLDQARRIVAPGFSVLPSPPSSTFPASLEQSEANSSTSVGRLVAVLQRWAEESKATNATAAIDIGAVTNPVHGWLAALDDGRLIAALGGAPTESVDDVLAAAAVVSQPARLPADDEAKRALVALESWQRSDQLRVDCGVSAEPTPLHRRASALLSALVRAARRHEQPMLIALAARIRHHLASPMPLAAERAVARCLESAAVTAANAAGILTQALTDLDAGARARTARAEPASRARVVAMIVVGPGTSGDVNSRNEARDDCESQPSRAL